METKICIYCGRALDLNQVSEKGGKYRCKDENDCLEYQTKEDPADSIDNADYISAVVKSSLSEAPQRIGTYKKTRDDRAKNSRVDHAEVSGESTAEFAWMKAAVDVLASEYKENSRFAFRYDGTNGSEYEISFHDEKDNSHFVVQIGNNAGSRYALVVAKKGAAAGTEPLYEEFIYKSYPCTKREEVVRDLSLILVIFEKEKNLLPALLNELRAEIESRQDNPRDGSC